MRTRKDVWKLPASDSTLLWYARAVADMQKRPVTDPTSWRYQAAIHDYISGQDPLAAPGEKVPPQSEQDTYWARCQHGTWYFLPWHRGFLFYFEQIVLAAVEKLGGPSDWALPYWNYSDPSNPNARCLPAAFWNPKLPDGSLNPLLVVKRAKGANSGQPLGTKGSPDVSACLKKPAFTNNSSGGASGFGGGRTGFSHNGGVLGACENTPHGSMHMAVGGSGGGWMSSFNTAGLDPIFWVHHANIDRLWEVWRDRDSSHTDPTLAAWLTGVTFDFHDATGAPVTLTASQMLDTTKPLLDYVYQDVSDPLAPAKKPAAAKIAQRVAPQMPRIPEMVGASDTKAAVQLGAAPTSVQIALRKPSGPAAKVFAAIAPEVHLNLENVTAGEGPIENYAVYVNLPDPAKGEEHPELKAGLIPAFGIVEASRRTKNHAGEGLSYSFDVTEIVSTLQKAKKWKAGSLRVTFVPERPESDPEPVSQARPVRVGRVSLYYA